MISKMDNIKCEQQLATNIDGQQSTTVKVLTIQKTCKQESPDLIASPDQKKLNHDTNTNNKANQHINDDGSSDNKQLQISSVEKCIPELAGHQQDSSSVENNHDNAVVASRTSPSPIEPKQEVTNSNGDSMKLIEKEEAIIESEQQQRQSPQNSTLPVDDDELDKKPQFEELLIDGFAIRAFHSWEDLQTQVNEQLAIRKAEESKNAVVTVAKTPRKSKPKPTTASNVEGGSSKTNGTKRKETDKSPPKRRTKKCLESQPSSTCETTSNNENNAKRKKDKNSPTSSSEHTIRQQTYQSSSGARQENVIKTNSTDGQAGPSLLLQAPPGPKSQAYTATSNNTNTTNNNNNNNDNNNNNQLNHSHQFGNSYAPRQQTGANTTHSSPNKARSAQPFSPYTSASPYNGANNFNYQQPAPYSHQQYPSQSYPGYQYPTPGYPTSGYPPPGNSQQVYDQAKVQQQFTSSPTKQPSAPNHYYPQQAPTTSPYPYGSFQYPYHYPSQAAYARPTQPGPLSYPSQGVGYPQQAAHAYPPSSHPYAYQYPPPAQQATIPHANQYAPPSGYPSSHFYPPPPPPPPAPYVITNTTTSRQSTSIAPPYPYTLNGTAAPSSVYNQTQHSQQQVYPHPRGYHQAANPPNQHTLTPSDYPNMMQSLLGPANSSAASGNPPGAMPANSQAAAPQPPLPGARWPAPTLDHYQWASRHGTADGAAPAAQQAAPAAASASATASQAPR